MTLSSRHRIRNSSPGGLRPSTLPLGHGGSPQYWLSHVDGEETFLFLSNRRDREPNSGVKGSGANHYPRAPALTSCVKQEPFYVIAIMCKLHTFELPHQHHVICSQWRIQVGSGRRGPDPPFLKLNCLNHLKPEFTIVIFIHYKPRIGVAIFDL